MRSPSLPSLLLVVLALLGTACSSDGTRSTEIEIVDGSIDTDPPDDANLEPDTDVPTNPEPGSELATTIDNGGEFAIDVEALIGTSWTLLFGGGPDGDLTAIDGWPITITFDGEFLGGTAACNGYGARYSIAGNRITLDRLSSTDAGCAPEVLEAESIYLRALADVDGIDVFGDELALSGIASELIFRRDAPAPAEEVTSNLWLLEATLQNGVETLVRGEPATLRIEPGGALVGGTGCRSANGSYVLSGNSFQLTSFSAQGSCPNALFAQDSMVISVLGDGFTAEVDGFTLTLTSQGNQGLRYRATNPAEVAGLEAVDVPTDADQLDGVTWIFLGGVELSGPLSVPAIEAALPLTITLTIEEGRFFGEAFCNDYGGQIEIGDGQWTFIDPVTEAGGCGPELDSIATAYLTALTQMTEFGLQPGGDVLNTNDGTIELRFIREGG